MKHKASKSEAAIKQAKSKAVKRENKLNKPRVKLSGMCKLEPTDPGLRLTGKRNLTIVVHDGPHARIC